MSIGFDSGTYHLVSCKRDEEGNFVYKKEINAFLEMPIEENRFVFNMMRDAGVPLVEREGADVAYALGEAAIQMAYTMSQIELRRPMKDGCLNPKEKSAQQIMSIMVHSLLSVSKPGETLYYSKPANAINEETDADYHGKILDAIFKAFKDENGNTVKAYPINEALALIYAELAAKQWTGIGVSCLVPGTKIYTNNGIKNIEDVTTDDKVITHKGRWKKINKIITKKFNGAKTKLQIQGYTNNTNNYQFVDNHELFVKRNNKWTWIGCEELKVGDIVGEPIIQQNRNATRPAINLCERTTCSKEWNKKRIESTPNLQRLIGYFLGDGSINPLEGSIQIDFGIGEKRYVNDAKEILLKCFDKKSSETIKNNNVIRLKCYSKGMISWFANHFYGENNEKTYPWDISRLTNSECLNLLTGLIRSDGTFNKQNGCSFYNTSTNLVILAKQLFSRLGVAASITYREPRSHFLKDEERFVTGKKNEWNISCHGKLCHMSLLDYMKNVNCENSKISEKIFIDGYFCCGRIQKIEHEEYSGKVYDLQIPEDHSFSGPFLTIHNCGAGMKNICFAMFGNPIFEFSLVDSGDWIDKMAAKATGETPTYINREKLKTDLSKDSDSLVQRAIKAQYEIMVQKTVNGIKKGLIDAGNKARSDKPIDIVVSGGTSSPPGFAELFKNTVEKANLPIEVGNIIKPKDPLYSVARACLLAAEAADKS